MKPVFQIFPEAKMAIEQGKCPVCKLEIDSFRNEKKKKEYGVSGLCQKCQDSVFGED